MSYLVIYWTQNAHNDFIFRCTIVLPPVGHSENLSKIFLVINQHNAQNLVL